MGYWRVEAHWALKKVTAHWAAYDVGVDTMGFTHGYTNKKSATNQPLISH
jgi:hypothetical protein